MNYDFREVEKNYPKSLAKLLKWKDVVESEGVRYNGTLTWYHGQYEEFNPRRLYDFFDENGIYGHVFPNVLSESDNRITNWEAELNFEHWHQPNFSSRSEAETALWNKCFEIMEGKDHE